MDVGVTVFQRRLCARLSGPESDTQSGLRSLSSVLRDRHFRRCFRLTITSGGCRVCTTDEEHQEYAQRRHYDMEGVDATFPRMAMRNASSQACAGSTRTKRGPEEAWLPMQAAKCGGDPGCSPKCWWSPIKNAQRTDRSPDTPRTSSTKPSRKPKNARRGAYGIRTGRKELQRIEGCFEPRVRAERRMAASPWRRKRRLQPMWPPLEHGRRKPGRTPMAMRCLAGNSLGKRGARETSYKGHVIVTHRPMVRSHARARWSSSLLNLTGEKDGQPSTAREEWSRKARRRPSMIAPRRAMKTLIRDPRPRHVNVAAQYPGTNRRNVPSFLTNYQ
ncbi:hypothetical protein Bca101_032654 [Brassica carinata]